MDGKVVATKPYEWVDPLVPCSGRREQIPSSCPQHPYTLNSWWPTWQCSLALGRWVGGTRGWGQPPVHNEFEVSLGYMRKPKKYKYDHHYQPYYIKVEMEPLKGRHKTPSTRNKRKEIKWSKNILAEVVVHAFNSTFGGKKDLCEYATSLVYVTRSCLKQNRTKQNKTQNKN